MGQEFTINSQKIEDKINALLPSQGGFGAGIDFSASTMIIPIIDLTESAEGSALRQDLQKSLSLTSITSFAVLNTTTTIVSTTGYYRVFGVFSGEGSSSGTGVASFSVTDGTTTKILTSYVLSAGLANERTVTPFDFIVFLPAGDSLLAITNSSSLELNGLTRQLADISGTLVNPL